MYTSEAINNTIKIAGETANTYTHPVFVFDQNGKPDLLASAITIKLEGKFYLISAAHVFKEIANASKVIYLAIESEFFQVPGKYVVSEVAETDHFDIGFMELTSEFVNQKKIPVLEFEMLMSYEFFESIYVVMIYGFPNTRNKQSKSLRGSTNFNTTAFVYAGAVKEEFSHWEELEKSKDVHTCMSFGKNPLGNEPIHPRGISGGGLWVIPDMEKPKEIYLDSILIEYHKRHRVTFSTKIANIIVFIRENA